MNTSFHNHACHPAAPGSRQSLLTAMLGLLTLIVHAQPSLRYSYKVILTGSWFLSLATPPLTAQGTSDSGTPLFTYSVTESVDAWFNLPPEFTGQDIDQIELLDLMTYQAERIQKTSLTSDSFLVGATQFISNTDPRMEYGISSVGYDQTGTLAWGLQSEILSQFPHSEMSMAAYQETRDYYLALMDEDNPFSGDPIPTMNTFQSNSPEIVVTEMGESAYSAQLKPGVLMLMDPQLRQQTLQLYDETTGLLLRQEVTVFCQEDEFSVLPCLKKDIAYRHFSDGTCYEQVVQTVYSDHAFSRGGLPTANPRSKELEQQPVFSFPNPTGQDFILTALHIKDELDVKLVDLQGRTIRQWTLSEPSSRGVQLPLHGIPSGLYVLSFTDGTFQKSHQLIIQE